MHTELRSIVSPLTDAIICPANGIAKMTAGAIAEIVKIAGPEVEQEGKALVKKRGKSLELADCFYTNPYKMQKRKVKRIYHVVTMKYPSNMTSLDVIGKAFKNGLECAIKDGMKSVAVCGLGTGQGRLDKAAVASIMIRIGRDYSHLIDISFIDINLEMVKEFGNLLGNILVRPVIKRNRGNKDEYSQQSRLDSE